MWVIDDGVMGGHGLHLEKIPTNSMFIKYFLSAKPWQLCLMMVVPYAVYKFTSFGHNPIDWGFLMLYFLVVALGWIYSVGISANRKLEANFQISPTYFRVAMVVPFLYLGYFVFTFLSPLYQGLIQRPPQSMIVLHFIALFTIGYCIWYAAKQLVTLLNNEETNFIDYYPTFMGLWIGFIGVWFLQPKIIGEFNDSERVDQTNA